MPSHQGFGSCRPAYVSPYIIRLSTPSIRREVLGYQDQLGLAQQTNPAFLLLVAENDAVDDVARSDSSQGLDAAAAGAAVVDDGDDAVDDVPSQPG